MYVGQDFKDMDVALECDLFSMDFTNVLQPSEVITGVTAQLSVVVGVDASPASRLSGGAGAAGNVVSQLIDVRGITASVQYLLVFVIATNLRPAVARWSHFWVKVPS